MTNNQEKIEQLLKKIEELTLKQEVFSKEIGALRVEVYQLKHSIKGTSVEVEDKKETIVTPVVEHVKEEVAEVVAPIAPSPKIAAEAKASPKIEKVPKGKSNLEKFIGENLINKIGILITVIGVGIGAKYSIENNLISPLTRIVLGYLMGIGLLGFGIKLKKKYASYSAVLVSGAIAIMYFITFLGYSLYGLFPQMFAFVLMVVFTVFTVIAALNYNKQVIALLGLVGAYAVPFLLSEGKGQVAILFTYMTIINIGIMVLSFKKYWKLLFYAAFAFTWIIYLAWFIDDYGSDANFSLALAFMFVFFVIFYVTTLAYKLLKKEAFEIKDIILLLFNSFFFYGLGFVLLADHEIGEDYLGLFTLFNGVLHFIVGVTIYKQKLADKNMLYFIIGMVLVFITITIPVQLDGNWVTLLWAGEAVLLFWIGRTKQISIYEKLAYPLLFLALFSLFHDWDDNSFYDVKHQITPLFNSNFLTSLFCSVSFGVITFIMMNKTYNSPITRRKWLLRLLNYAVPIVFLGVLFNTFNIEIVNYWDQRYNNAIIDGNYNYSLNSYKQLWQLNYSMLFVAILSFINIKWLKNKELGTLNIILNSIVILAFMTSGLYVLGELREDYLLQAENEYFVITIFTIIVRYVSFVFLAVLLYACYLHKKTKIISVINPVVYNIVLQVILLWIASSELIHWLDMSGSGDSYKLGLSILWGIYSLGMIGFGIWKNKKYLRIMAMVLFGITLIKLFFYDISHLETIAKTIVFVSLGILLLIISFLYNKYKHLISDETED